MKNCTGKQYEGQHLQLANFKGWHGKYGHLNVLVLDHEDDCTDYGKHDRVVPYCPEGDTLLCRVDHVWQLGMPTPAQVLKAAKKRNGSYQRGKFVFDKKETSEDGKTTDFYFLKT